MTTYVPPKKNTGYFCYVSLVSQADTNTFQSSPSLASGDAQVSKDGGNFANLGTLPTVTPTSSKLVKITLSSDEMNADNVAVLLSDAEGDQWQDLLLSIQTVTSNQIDDLSTFDASSSTVTLADSGLTAAKIATGAFAVDKFGASAIAASNISTGAFAVGKFGASAIAASNIGGSAFDSTLFQTGAIHAAAIATGAFAAGKFGASAIASSNIGASSINSTTIGATGADKIADHTLRREWGEAASSGDGDTKAGRSLLGATAKLVNKIAESSGSLIVYEADDSTSLFTQDITTSSTAAYAITVLDTT